ncbi:MAG: CHC2 zinc finger domain-containing protein [Bacteroidota bacterium]
MEIQDIKQRLTLAEVIKHYGHKADKQNRINCPFHEDKTPSMQLYWKTHTCFCFSSNCKTHGKAMDVIDFIMYKESITKHQAIEKAKTLINGNPTSVSSPTRENFLQNMFTYFCNAVHNSPPAKDYLQQRNLDYKALAATGTPAGYNAGQYHHGKRKDETLIALCLEHGLLVNNGLTSRTGEVAYNVFGKWCICFAMKNKKSEVTGLYFRSILNDKSKRHYYLKNSTGLYPHYPKAATKKLILTESIIDAATLLQQENINHHYGVLAMYGTNRLTEEHIKAIKELKELEEIIFFLNGDEPGRQSVHKYAPLLQNEIPHIIITNAEPPEGEDVNSLLQSHRQGAIEHIIEGRKQYKQTEQTKTFSFSIETPTTENQQPLVNPNEKKEPVTTNTQPITTNKEQQTNLPSAGFAKGGNEKQGLNSKNPYRLSYTGKNAHYSIKGTGWLNQPLDTMKIALQVISLKTKQDYRTRVDLYEYKQVNVLAQYTADKLQLNAEETEKELSVLAHLLEEYREQRQEKNLKNPEPYRIQLNESTQQSCIKFLTEKGLMPRLNNLVGLSGIVGEEQNRIFLFIIASSYKMKHTLHALIQGSSGSGKTRLLKIISELMPLEDVKKYTRVTDSSFYNQDEYFFTNKLVCFEDYDGLKEDAQLAVRELQSNEILISSTSIKDDNGKITGGERIVRGPIASLGCTTKGEIYEDNISRCFVIAVDESKQQTLRVIKYQNEVAAGIIDKEKEKSIREFLQNCMRLLKPYNVVNPYANRITLPEDAHKIRRLNELYQSLVRQITILHQYQRKKDTQGRLITEKEDLQAACDIMFESIVLKVDELDGSLRQFYEKLKQYVRSKAKKQVKNESDTDFNRFEVRQATGVSKTQQHFYLTRLVHMEYIHQYGFGNRGYKYKIAQWDNMEAVRAKIKDSLFNQLEQLEEKNPEKEIIKDPLGGTPQNTKANTTTESKSMLISK